MVAADEKFRLIMSFGLSGADLENQSTNISCWQSSFRDISLVPRTMISCRFLLMLAYLVLNDWPMLCRQWILAKASKAVRNMALMR